MYSKLHPVTALHSQATSMAPEITHDSPLITPTKLKSASTVVTHENLIRSEIRFRKIFSQQGPQPHFGTNKMFPL